jgi:hypothetical protein
MVNELYPNDGSAGCLDSIDRRNDPECLVLMAARQLNHEGVRAALTGSTKPGALR